MKSRGWPRRRPRLFAVAGLIALTVTAACTPPGLPAPIAPTASSADGSIPAAEPSVTIGVDGTVGGFNPHTIADYSLADSAVSALVLPSVSFVAPDGSSVLNHDVVTRAEVTATDPFTVTYTLDRNASWSDGTPITAEDFGYLRDQMLIEPGTVDPAGYRLISSIQSKDAGKTVQVEFVHSLPDWMTLFSPLLPSHILKDVPGGWAEGLATGLPVSGNRYKMLGYDTVTGEITLVRNDKYWGTQPTASTAVLRIGTSAALIAAFRRGDLQALLLQPGLTDEATLAAAVPAAQRVSVPQPGTVQLVFNNAGGPAADSAVRAAVVDGIDVPLVRSLLAGGNPDGMAAAGSLVDLSATAAPATGSPTDAAAVLAAAGYHRESIYQSKNGTVLRLTLAYPSGDARMAAVAGSIQRQLAAIGIEVDLVRDGLRSLVDDRMALGTVDLGLVFVPRSPSNALAAGSAFGCPAPVTRTDNTTPPAAPRTGNLSGFCSTATQTLLGRAALGTDSPELQSELQLARPVLQIGRPIAFFAATSPIAAKVIDIGPGMAWNGPLSTLPSWPSG